MLLFVLFISSYFNITVISPCLFGLPVWFLAVFEEPYFCFVSQTQRDVRKPVIIKSKGNTRQQLVRWKMEADMSDIKWGGLFLLPGGSVSHGKNPPTAHITLHICQRAQLSSQWRENTCPARDLHTPVFTAAAWTKNAKPATSQIDQ